ncbi:MAG: hypothetical protein R2725_11005 [Solirubrobacterales bacterium]
MVASEALLGALAAGARRRRRTLVSFTAEVGLADPCAAVFASRLADNRWFCWEQPDRGFALAGLGTVHAATSRGAGRFGEIAEECLRAGRDAVIEKPPGLPPGAGPVWLGGFAFEPEGGATSTWSSLAPASMFLPELSLCRLDGRTFLTLNAIVAPGEDAGERAAALAARAEGLRDRPLPLIDPHPTEPATIRSARPPAEFEAAVAAATERIEAGR